MAYTADHYAETAFDSRTSYDQLSDDEANLSKTYRKTRKNRLPFGVYCGEFMALSDPFWAGPELSKPDERMRRLLYQGERHDRLLLQAPHSIYAWLGTIRQMAGIVLFFFALSSVVFLIDGSGISGTFSFYLGFMPFIIFACCFATMKFWTPSETHNNTMRRRTGLVYIGRWFGRGERPTLPFAEFAGVWYTSTTPAGGLNTHLGMFHRYSSHAVAPSPSAIIDDTWVAALYWEYFQAFMDTSRPLPDVPELEHCRHLDPVTAAHDKRTGRNPHYWRDIGEDKAEVMRKEARERAKAMLTPENLHQRAIEQFGEVPGEPSGDWQSSRTWD